MDPLNLPIYELEKELLAALREGAGAGGARVLVQAPTGSGKSTQIPKILLKHGLGGTGTAGEIVVLQPRRLATRMLARRVAAELGRALGETVGYQIRLESRVSAQTRIRFVTEGVLLRQMLADGQLSGVGAIVFDEFHERHLYGDITLARALQIQRSTRPDLRLIVMSATLDTEALERYLAPCRVLTSAGRTFPVKIDYLPRAVSPDTEPVWELAARECERLVAESPDGSDVLVFMPGVYEINRTLQALQARRGLRDFECLPLHGELPAAQQDRAVGGTASGGGADDTASGSQRSGVVRRRKIIVSTNVAETSLTIEGVTLVIDSGLARVARYDPRRGINTLLVEKISIASADQRAGRAGRTAPGTCLRLWTAREHERLNPQELPEVKRIDLAEVVLTLKASGIDDLVGFNWIEAPSPDALARAERLLEDLGALSRARANASAGGGGDRGDSGGNPRGTEEGAASANTFPQITALGRQMLRFPLHPRYARMLIEAGKRSCVREVALMAALTQGRSFLLRGVSKEIAQARERVLGEEHESDFLLLVRAWEAAQRAGFDLGFCRELGIHAQAARQVGPLYEQFLKIARAAANTAWERDYPRSDGRHSRTGSADGVSGDAAAAAVPAETAAGDSDLRKCVLAGFSDQVARRLDSGTLRCELVHGRRGLLARESVCQRAALMVIGEITEVGGRGEVSTVLGLATAIEEPWLAELFPEDYAETTGVVYDEAAKRVVARRERRFRDLALEARMSSEEVPPSAAAALLAREVLAGRLKLKHWDEAVEQWIVRVNRLAEWFPELGVSQIGEADRALLIEQLCYGETSARAVREKPVMPVLREWLSAEQLAALDQYLPERLVMANGGGGGKGGPGGRSGRARLRYLPEGPPILSARIQELYGVESRFTLGAGRVPVRIEVLAPNQRPIQITDDLALFWREQYPKIRSELSRRYPRHEWREL
ncbi:helicase [Cephaloticoccus primus]|uniref:Helicase n=1 Tax=Cephaloticoccus primus TaxID=1548207 RepID=A0A139SMM0_9BACT|nr:ATP-dependent RNA helicase [Cephaloticoccus primus]KXU35827.1 helicase [Cephaloticoccus primus]